MTHDLTLELINKVDCRLCRAASGNDVVNDEDFLTLLDGILLHLEQVLAIFLDILGSHTGAGKLALLSNGNKSDAETQCEARAKEEAAGIQSNNDIGLGVGKRLSNFQFEGGDESGVGVGIGEQGHDIDKVDAGDGEVGEMAKMIAQAYLCTGELGGGGGGGGGLSSRGILLGSCGRGCLNSGRQV